MPAPSIEDIRFVFDEDSRGFGLAVSRLRSDMSCVGTEPVANLLPLGITDPAWIPLVADRGWVVITKNWHIRTQPAEAALALEHGLVIACLMEPRKNATRWDFAQLIFRHWEAIEGLAANPGPAWLSVHKDRTRPGEYKPGDVPRAPRGQL